MGLTGLPGPAGVAGEPGPAGPTGVQGPVGPTNVAGAGLEKSAATISIDPSQGVDTPASLLGLVGDGVTDNAASFSAAPQGLRVHLADGATYAIGTNGTGGAVRWPSNTQFWCYGCRILYRGAVTAFPFSWQSGSNQRYDGLTFDLGGVNTGGYQGANIASTAVTVLTGGSGFAPGFFGIGFTGGCGDTPLGYATVNGSGAVTAVTITRNGGGCTSTPTIANSFTTYPSCPRSGTCTAPTFSYAAPTNTGGPAHTYGFYVTQATNWQCYDCWFQSTGSTPASTSLYMDGLKLYSSSFTVVRPHVASTVAGYQIDIDTNGSTAPGKVDTPYLNGSGFDALQVKSTAASGAGDIEIAGGFCTNNYDASYGTGQWGNCYSIFEVSNVNLHDGYALGPRFSGVRVTGSSSAAQTHLTQFNIVSRMHILGCGETGIYLELGSEWGHVDANQVIGCNSGINGDNADERPDNGINLITNNLLRDNVAFGIHAVHDKVQGNIVINSPIGYMFGNGGDGYGLNADSNRCFATKVPGTIPMQVCFAVDQGLKSAVTNQNINLHAPSVGASSGPAGYEVAGPIPVAALSNYAGVSISAMTLASPPVFTLYGGTPVANGQTWILRNIPGATLSDGVTPVNGQLCVIGSATATSFACTNLNTTGGVPFALPLYGNAAAAATLLYTSGTTQLPWPSQVTMLGQ